MFLVIIYKIKIHYVIKGERMKLLILALLSLNLFAAPKVALDTKCYQIADNVDREYCQKKKISLLQKSFATEQSSWKKGMSSATKAQKTKEVNEQVAEAKEMISVYQKKLEMLEDHKAKLASAKVITPKKKKKKKKKKRSDLEKALNIKL